jgi:hypothetical protein
MDLWHWQEADSQLLTNAVSNQCQPDWLQRMPSHPTHQERLGFARSQLTNG